MENIFFLTSIVKKGRSGSVAVTLWRHNIFFGPVLEIFGTEKLYFLKQCKLVFICSNILPELLNLYRSIYTYFNPAGLHDLPENQKVPWILTLTIVKGYYVVIFLTDIKWFLNDELKLNKNSFYMANLFSTFIHIQTRLQAQFPRNNTIVFWKPLF